MKLSYSSMFYLSLLCMLLSLLPNILPAFSYLFSAKLLSERLLPEGLLSADFSASGITVATIHAL